MYEYLPLLISGSLICLFAAGFLVAYALEKNKKESMGFDRHMSDGKIIRRLLQYAKPYWKSFALALVVMVISVGYDVISPLLIGDITSIIKEEFSLNDLYIRVGIYAGILVVSLVCTYLQAMILQKTGQKILSRIREDVFTHAEALSHHQLSNIPVGKLVTRVCNDPNNISYMFTNILVTLAKNMMIVVGVLAAMFALNYGLALIAVCFVPFVILFTLMFRKFSRKAHRQVSDATTAVNTFLSENLSGMKIIQIFNRQERKYAEFSAHSGTLTKAKKNRMFVFGIFRPTVYMIYITSVLFLFYFSAKGYITDSRILGTIVTSEVVVAFYLYLNKFFNPIQALAEQFDALQRSFAAAEKIFTVLDMEPEVVDAPDAIELDSIEGKIEFEDVWFAYKPGEWVLKGVSFTVEPRQTVAFVGSTGSGKTTILSLLCRNYDIQKGRILVDGIDIRTIKKSSLRRHFGQMLQDVFLFSGTIRSNILLRKEDVSDEQIWEACRYVNADRFISRLEKGLDEEVRERGNNFSAGQRQLLSFARTIVHKPSVMILDEATANIDTETEALIQDSLEKMKNIGTMLVVAHRLSTIQHADNIIVLSKGQILEQGNHQALLQKQGRYHQLFMLQYTKEQLTSQN